MTTKQRTPIRILDSASIDRIAAGEVIERPASVVKELVENALDAGARNLRISVTAGGTASIVVEDDGHGVPADELPLVFERHATSKIVSAADILHIDSFGFRGEAMASIGSVSRTTLLSRTEDEPVGASIRITGGEMERREPAPRNRGTTVTVEDLFFNTPARRKYLKSTQAEKRAIVQLVTGFALAYPELRWTLVCDGTVVFDLLPVDSLPIRARDLLGAQVSEHLARFSREEGGIVIGGLASRPTLTRNNRGQQFLYVNRRPVSNRTLAQAVQQAYRDVIPPGRHPVVILFVQVPPGEVDVNVHPAKTEVRLMLERHIFGMIVTALREGLDLRADPSFQRAPELPAGTGIPGPLQSRAEAWQQELRERFGGGGSKAGAQASLFGPDPAVPAPAEQEPESPAAPASPALHGAPFWQLHRTYICTQTRGGLLIIDQHNSHERILYNEAKRALAGGEFRLPVQQLLFPVHLELTPQQVQVFQEHAGHLERLGFLVQPFGGQSILVQGIPSALKNWNDGQLLLDILDELADAGTAGNADTDALLASFSCHGAIKAGTLLTVPEMQHLVDKLFATDTPFSCPHGRPTLIQFSLAELEQRFGRR